MGILFKTFALLALIGCGSNTGLSKDAGLVYEAKQHVSIFSNDVRLDSRNAAVEIISYNSDGNKISGSGAYVVYKSKYSAMFLLLMSLLMLLLFL